MIAVDSNVLIDSFGGRLGPAVMRMREAVQDDDLVLPPPVVTEVLSFPGSDRISAEVRRYAQLEILPGFWERAAETRRTLIARGLRARLPDALIAQCCIDADITLITSDTDFRHFSTHCGLKLAI